jgi:aerobic carbon-monoxide dehydrogenase small subunit
LELQTISYELKVNGTTYQVEGVEPRMLLADALRDVLGFTGTHLGCEHGVCGACTVLIDGLPARSCLIFGIQAQGHEIITVEGLSPDEEHLSPLQQAFWEEHGLQCGFCTSGILTTMSWFLKHNPTPTRAEIREALSGNICRCTGYQNIVTAVERAAAYLASGAAANGVDPDGNR